MFYDETDDIKEFIEKLINGNDNEIIIDKFKFLYAKNTILKLNELFLEILKLKKKYKIIIGLNKASEFDLINIHKYKQMGLEFRICLDDFTYSYNEFYDLNEKLDKKIMSIVYQIDKLEFLKLKEINSKEPELFYQEVYKYVLTNTI